MYTGKANHYNTVVDFNLDQENNSNSSDFNQYFMPSHSRGDLDIMMGYGNELCEDSANALYLNFNRINDELEKIKSPILPNIMSGHLDHLGIQGVITT